MCPALALEGTLLSKADGVSQCLCNKKKKKKKKKKPESVQSVPEGKRGSINSCSKLGGLGEGWGTLTGWDSM